MSMIHQTMVWCLIIQSDQFAQPPSACCLLHVKSYEMSLSTAIYTGKYCLGRCKSPHLQIQSSAGEAVIVFSPVCNSFGHIAMFLILFLPQVRLNSPPLLVSKSLLHHLLMSNLYLKLAAYFMSCATLLEWCRAEY